MDTEEVRHGYLAQAWSRAKFNRVIVAIIEITHVGPPLAWTHNNTMQTTNYHTKRILYAHGCTCSCMRLSLWDKGNTITILYTLVVLHTI